MAKDKEKARAESDRLVEAGIDLFQKGQAEKALSQFRRATEIDPTNEVAWNNMGYTLKVLERFDEAVECYTKAVEIDPYYEEAWYNLGVAQIASNRFKDAKDCLERALEIDPNDADARAHLDLCRKKLSEIERKKKEWLAKRKENLKKLEKAKKSKPKPRPKPKPMAKAPAPSPQPAMEAVPGDNTIRPDTAGTTPEVVNKGGEPHVIAEEEQREIEGAISRSEQMRTLLNVSGADADLERELERQKALEERMRALRASIEEASKKYGDLRKNIETEIEDVEKEKRMAESEMAETLEKEVVGVRDLEVKSEIESKIALEVGAELESPKALKEVEERKVGVKQVEEEYRKRVEEKERILKEKKSEFDNVVKEEEEFLSKAKEEEAKLKKELEAIMKRIADYMDKELLREGIDL